MVSSFGSHFKYSATFFNLTDRNLVTFFLSLLRTPAIILLSPVRRVTGWLVRRLRSRIAGWPRSGPVGYRPSPQPEVQVSCPSHARLSCTHVSSLVSAASFPRRVVLRSHTTDRERSPRR